MVPFKGRTHAPTVLKRFYPGVEELFCLGRASASFLPVMTSSSLAKWRPANFVLHLGEDGSRWGPVLANKVGERQVRIHHRELLRARPKAERVFTENNGKS